MPTIQTNNLTHAVIYNSRRSSILDKLLIKLTPILFQFYKSIPSFPLVLGSFLSQLFYPNRRPKSDLNF